MAVLTRQQNLTAAATTTTLPTLPFELIIEILCNLPVKFLIKLKCVCKSWNSLFTDHKFTKKHFNSTKNLNLILKSTPKYSSEFSHMVYPLRSLLTDVTTEGTEINFPLMTDEYSTHIVCSCDGLLFLAQAQYTNHGVCRFRAVLWNPSIRKYKILPSPNFPHENFVRPIYDFGYDHLTCNYKVVAIFRYIYKTQVKVHTLGTDSWKLIEDFPSVFYSSSRLDSGKFVSGTINWLVPIDCPVALRPIVSLDLGTESYEEILQPDYGEEDVLMVKSCSLGVLRDCLCILVGHGMCIWLMKEYGNRESWIRLVNISNSTNFTFICNVLYIFEHDQVLLEMFEWGLAVYDSVNGTMKTLHVEKFNDLRLCHPKIYTESLIWPCS